MSESVKTLSELVVDAIFNLLVQGKKSVIPISGFAGSTCAYRSCTGEKCIIGWIVPDEKYVHEMDCSLDKDGRSISYVLRANRLVLGVLVELVGRELTEDELEFLTQLQGCHDHVYDHGEGESGFSSKFGCNVNDMIIRNERHYPNLYRLLTMEMYRGVMDRYQAHLRGVR